MPELHSRDNEDDGESCGGLKALHGPIAALSGEDPSHQSAA